VATSIPPLAKIEQQPDRVVRLGLAAGGQALDRTLLDPQAVEQPPVGAEAPDDPVAHLHPVPGGRAGLRYGLEQLLVEQLREELGDQPASGRPPAVGGQHPLGDFAGLEAVGGGHWKAPWSVGTAKSVKALRAGSR
jgi:hypothetical protein